MHNPTPAILSTLRAFVCSRPGLDPRNYISSWNDTNGRRAYFADARQIARDRRDALALLASMERMAAYDPSILADLQAAASNRLTWNGESWDYCTGQYFPVEYRRAACRVLSDAFHAHNVRVYGGDLASTRKNARSLFGRGIASRYFA